MNEAKVVVLLPPGLILEDLVRLGPHLGKIARMPLFQDANVREITLQVDQNGRVTGYNVIDKYSGEKQLKGYFYAIGIFDESGGIRIREGRSG